MKSSLRLFAYLLIFAGIIWILQGINLLPGSFMTGQFEWAIYGSIAVAVGLILVYFTGRGKS